MITDATRVPSTVTDQSLRTAYEATEYWVDDAPGGRFHVRIRERSPALDRLLVDTGLDEWVYIMACNPRSRRLSNEDNARRMNELERQLRLLPCVIYRGRGVGTDGNWPPEPSLLVLGLGEDQGLEVAGTFGQAAIVAGRIGEPARLVWAI
jgi:hypothetical protein